MPSELGKKPNNRPNGRNHSGWKRFMRLLRLRLIVPLLRAKHEPEYTARGVFVGVALGLTPTVGIQMPMVMVVWAIVRAITPKWNFNMIVAIAWVWLSNVFTLGPLYYGFLVTGRIMMGYADAVPGYHTFSVELMKALEVEADGLKGFWDQTVNLFDLYGVPMLVGCIPWALIWGWIGYVWTQKYLHRRNRMALERRAQRNPAPESAE